MNRIDKNKSVDIDLRMCNMGSIDFKKINLNKVQSIFSFLYQYGRFVLKSYQWGFCTLPIDCVVWFCTLPIGCDLILYSTYRLCGLILYITYRLCGLILYITYRLCGLLSFHLNQQMRVPKVLLQTAFQHLNVLQFRM
jgi:hypothetical protein